MDQLRDIDAIKRTAAQRARTLALPYAGALTPLEAYLLWQAGARLVDVRTRAELDWVGRIPESLFVEWNGYPGNARNPDFLAQLEDYVAKDDAVLFVCRSGQRSHHAAVAATQAGWRECYNVLEGFEGDKDAQQHRGNVNGWKKAGLPWMQG